MMVNSFKSERASLKGGDYDAIAARDQRRRPSMARHGKKESVPRITRDALWSRERSSVSNPFIARTYVLRLVHSPPWRESGDKRGDSAQLVWLARCDDHFLRDRLTCFGQTH